MKAKELLDHMGWAYYPSGDNQAKVKICPYCQNNDSKFYVNISDSDANGLHDCKSCHESGNLHTLKQLSGFSMGGVVSMKDSGMGTPSKLPDMDNLHKALLDDEKFGDVLEFLLDRGFSMATIQMYKLGALHREGVNYAIYPYFDAAGNATNFKGRSVSGKKKFIAPANRAASLFNSSCLTQGMAELVMVEGEADCLSLLNQGYLTAVGVPGASNKKTEWIDKLDSTQPKKIYILYDNDKAGQAGALALARKVGIEKAWNIILPQFEITPATDTTPAVMGKDLNEWWKTGKTLEEFEALKGTARQFDVGGISGLCTTLEELKEEILKKGGATATFTTPWPSLNKRMGGCEEGDLVGVIAEGKVGKTTFCLNLIDHFSQIGYPSLMFCLEMLPKRMVRKWVSMATQTPDEVDEHGVSKITVDVINQGVDIAMKREGDLLFGYSKASKHEEVFDTIRQAVRRYGVKFVCFDNLQLMSRSLEHQNTEISKLAYQFKELAMELGIVIFLIIQPHRVPEGQIVSARNSMGSSTIEKAVDCMLCCHRNRTANLKKEADFQGFIETEQTFEPQLLIKVDLSRYAGGGICTLWFDGLTSTVREMLTDDLLSTAGTGQQPGGIQVEKVEV